MIDLITQAVDAISFGVRGTKPNRPSPRADTTILTMLCGTISSICMDSVSYTHLDVYKRQLYDGEPTDAARIEQDFLDHCISCQDKLAHVVHAQGVRPF